MDFKELMKTIEYDYLRTNERLGNRIKVEVFVERINRYAVTEELI